MILFLSWTGTGLLSLDRLLSILVKILNIQRGAQFLFLLLLISMMYTAYIQSECCHTHVLFSFR